jgi:hypothetical protein
LPEHIQYCDARQNVSVEVQKSAAVGYACWPPPELGEATRKSIYKGHIRNNRPENVGFDQLPIVKNST